MSKNKVEHLPGNVDRTTDVLLDVRERRLEQELQYPGNKKHGQDRWVKVVMHELGGVASGLLLLENGEELVNGIMVEEYIRTKWLDVAAAAAAAIEQLDRSTDPYEEG